MDTMLQHLDTILRAFQLGTSSPGEEMPSEGPSNDPPNVVESLDADADRASPLGQLPPHIALEVVPFLECGDLGSAALVCQAWLGASNSAVKSLQPLNLKPLALTHRFVNLERLDLSRVQGLDDQRLGAVGAFVRLRSLRLKRCREITSEGLNRLSNLTQLTALSLARCPQITDEGVCGLARVMPDLGSLNIKFCHRISDEVLRLLGMLQSFTVLNCTACRKMTDVGMEFLAAGPCRLQKLKINECPAITDAGMLSIGRLSSLETLQCRMESAEEQQKGDESFNIISTALSHLTRLDIGCGQGMTVEGIGKLSRLSELKTLWLGASHLPGDVLVGSVVPVFGLSTLSIVGTSGLSDCGAGLIAKLSDLKSLDLRGHKNRPNPLTDKGLVVLTALDKLCRLRIAGFPFVKGSVLSRLSSITELHCNNCESVSDDTLKGLSSLPKLEVLSFSDCPGIGCLHASYLSELSMLSCLTLNICKHVSDAAMKAVGNLSSLEELNLGLCNGITDAGIAVLREGKMTQLRYLNTAGCANVSAKAVEELKVRWPELRTETQRLNVELLHLRY